MSYRSLIAILLASLVLSACAPTPDRDAAIATNVAATLEAGASAVDAVATSVAATIQAESPGPTDEPPAAISTIPTLGTVAGKICYPSSGIPAMTLYLLDSDENLATSVDIAQNQDTFQLEVPPGSYTAFAWLPGFGYGGSYSQAVPCGLAVGCDDHSLIPFAVTAGETTSGIDVCDWYGAPDSVPLPPGVEVSPGAITGALSYPSSFIPPLDIIATNVNTNDWFFISTAENTTTYLFADLPPGEYTLIAYISGESGDYGGGYTQAVLCGLSVDCSDHSLISVFVTSGQTTPGVDLTDWYAPPGSFPPNPLP